MKCEFCQNFQHTSQNTPGDLTFSLKPLLHPTKKIPTDFVKISSFGQIIPQNCHQTPKNWNFSKITKKSSFPLVTIDHHKHVCTCFHKKFPGANTQHTQKPYLKIKKVVRYPPPLVTSDHHKYECTCFHKKFPGANAHTHTHTQ